MVPKEGKRSNSGQIPEVVPVPKQGGTDTAQQKKNGTGIGASGTGTAQQNAIGTGTDQSDTGTVVSKMPRFDSFSYLSLNSCTDSIGTLLND